MYVCMEVNACNCMSYAENSILTFPEVQREET